MTSLRVHRRVPEAAPAARPDLHSPPRPHRGASLCPIPNSIPGASPPRRSRARNRSPRPRRAAAFRASAPAVFFSSARKDVWSPSPPLSVSDANLGGGTRMARACATGARCVAGAPRRRVAHSSAPPNPAAPRRPAATANPSNPPPRLPEKKPPPKNRPPASVSRATSFGDCRSSFSRVSRLFPRSRVRPAAPPPPPPPLATRARAPSRARARRASS